MDSRDDLLREKLRYDEERYGSRCTCAERPYFEGPCADCERRDERTPRCASCDDKPARDDCKGLCETCFETTEVA